MSAMDESITRHKLAANWPTQPPRASNRGQVDAEPPSSCLKHTANPSLGHNECINGSSGATTTISQHRRPSPRTALEWSTFAAVTASKLDGCCAMSTQVSRERRREAAPLRSRPTLGLGFMAALSFIFTVSQAGKFAREREREREPEWSGCQLMDACEARRRVCQLRQTNARLPEPPSVLVALCALWLLISHRVCGH